MVVAANRFASIVHRPRPHRIYVPPISFFLRMFQRIPQHSESKPTENRREYFRATSSELNVPYDPAFNVSIPCSP